MTVATEKSHAELAWTGVETAFAAGFTAQDVSHIAVTYGSGSPLAIANLVPGIHVYVLRDAATNAITVTPIAGAMPAAPGTVIIDRVTPGLQQTTFGTLGPFSPALHQQLHDAAALRDDELKYRMSRSILAPTNEVFSATWPAQALRANGGLGSYAGFDGSGNPTIFVTSPPTGYAVMPLNSNQTITGTFTFAHPQIPVVLQNGGPGLFYISTDSTNYYTGTAQSGSSNTLRLALGTVNMQNGRGLALNDSSIVGATIAITSGAGVGQPLKRITAFNNATLDLTISSTWSPAPDSTTHYSIGRFDYPYTRLIYDKGAFYFEFWEASDPTNPALPPYEQQDEWLRFNRWIHNASFNYPVTGNGNRDFWISANYVWDAEAAQTPRNLSLMALNSSTNAQVEALRLTPNGANPFFFLPFGVSFSIGRLANTTPLEVNANSSGSVPGTVSSGTIAHLIGANASAARLAIDAIAGTANVSLRRADGTAASPSAVQNGDVIGSVGAYGYGATGYAAASRASISLSAAENWTDAAQGTSVSISTTPTGSTVAATNLFIGPSGGVSVGNVVDAGPGNLSVTGTIFAASPLTKTASYALGSSDFSLIFNNAGGSSTLTLPTAANSPGRLVLVKTTQAQTVVSASANVVPLAGGAAGTAILAATAGKWALLQSDGTSWQTMMAN
jgi:hypothetical protein